MRSKLALAVDSPGWEEATSWITPLVPFVGVLKVGLELFCREGPSCVRAAQSTGCDVFLDLKLHDIPETMDRAVASVAELGVRFLTVHAAAGPRALERVARRAEGSGLTLLAVTVLTSLESDDLGALGVPLSASSWAMQLAKLATDAGAKGLVCSPWEVASLRASLGPTIQLVTPGIRLAGDPRGDQKRVATPGEALRAGADLLVLGRALRDASDPIAAARAIHAEVKAATQDLS